MADSRRKRILDAVKVRLQYIKTQYGFNTELGVYADISLNRLEERKTPSVTIFPTEEDPNRAYSANMWTLPIIIEGVHAYATDGVAYELEDNMISDITEAMEAVHFNIEFDTGNSEVSVGDTLKNGVVTWYVSHVVVNSGTWAGGTAAGNIWVRRGSEPLNTFSSGDLPDIIGGDTNVIQVVSMTNVDQIGLNVVTGDLKHLVDNGGIKHLNHGLSSAPSPASPYLGAAVLYELIYKVRNGNPYG